MNDQRVITIGASSGGVAALQRLVQGLPADLAAPVVVVQHIGMHPSRLPVLLERAGRLKASHAADGDTLRPGHLHVAPPDHHVLIDGPLLRVTNGPKEHFTRPAIDPLFRSAALSHGPNVIGVVLTGALDDGTAGLQAIKDGGGVAIVQDPADAEEPSMPESALRHVPIDHCLPLADMPDLMTRLAQRPRPPVDPMAMAKWRHEQMVGLHQGDIMEHMEAIATPSTFSCPDCKGTLWSISGARPVRFICHTGHSYTLRSLQQAQSTATDEALWAAIRALQEKQFLLLQGADTLEAEGDRGQAADARALAKSIEKQGELLRKLVVEPPR